MSTLTSSSVNKLLVVETLVGSYPLAIKRFCASTVFFSRTVSAYVSLIDFGLTAKQPFFSTNTVELNKANFRNREVKLVLVHPAGQLVNG